MSAPTVFLSAVTNDFGLPFLEKLRQTIQHPGIACRFRGNLEQGGRILPEKLHGEIKAASCVIHLVGPGFGFGPQDVMLPELERTPANRRGWQRGATTDDTDVHGWGSLPPP